MKSLQLDKPHAIVMTGIQGSGKTFFASKFSETFHAPYISQSEIAKLSADDEAATRLVRMTIDQLVKTKQSIILEVNTDTKSSRAALVRLLKDAGYTPLIVWVQVDADTAYMRSQKNSGISLEHHAADLKRFSPPQTSEKAVVISGKHTYATQARAVLKRLAAPRNSQPAPRTAPVRGQIIVR